MTILVFGRTGQVSSALNERPGFLCLGRDQADLVQPGACAAAIAAHAPRAVINAAAHTAVDDAETQTDLAMQINGAAPGEMARACAEAGIPLVHISTDYVFDGTGDQPWTPDHPVAPMSAYGRSKLAGEEAVRAAGGSHAILRTSWVFSATGRNFVKTILRLAESRDRLTIVADQIGGPTPAGAIADACAIMAEVLITDPDKSGTYHFSGAPDVSWADFAREILRQAGRTGVEVADITTADFPTPAKRPANSRMDCTSLETVFGIARPDWRADLTQILKDIQD